MTKREADITVKADAIDDERLTNVIVCGKLGLSVDSDDFLSFHYIRNGRRHRLVLMRLDPDGVAFIKHPAGNYEVPIGYHEKDESDLHLDLKLARS